MRRDGVVISAGGGGRWAGARLESRFGRCAGRPAPYPIGHLLWSTRPDRLTRRMSGRPRGQELFAQQVCQTVHGRDSGGRDPDACFVLDAGA